MAVRFTQPVQIGLLAFRFPIHAAGGPSEERASHLENIGVPKRAPMYGGTGMSGLRQSLHGVVFIGLGLCCLVSSADAAPSYIPDGPTVPAITLNETQSGAADLSPLPVPAPKGWDKESIWNMQVVGFQDNQGRPSSDDGWIENQSGRYIAYVANSPGKALNPLDRKNRE